MRAKYLLNTALELSRLAGLCKTSSHCSFDICDHGDPHKYCTLASPTERTLELLLLQPRRVSVSSRRRRQRKSHCKNYVVYNDCIFPFTAAALQMVVRISCRGNHRACRRRVLLFRHNTQNQIFEHLCISYNFYYGWSPMQ